MQSLASYAQGTNVGGLCDAFRCQLCCDVLKFGTSEKQKKQKSKTKQSVYLSRGLSSAAGMQPLAGEGNIYQKRYPTLSWQINSYKLTSPHKSLYRLWGWGGGKKSKCSLWKDAPNELDVKLMRAAHWRDLWITLSPMQKAPTRHERVMEVQWKCSLHAPSPLWY